jgi:D-alanine transaminase
LLLYNGTFMPREDVRISFEDRGYYFGDGVYEVFRIYNGMLYEKEAHLRRLERSAREIRLPLPFALDEISEMIHALVEKENVADGILYLQITRGVAPRSHLFPEQTAPTLLAYCKPVARPVQAMEQGISAITIPDLRWLRCDIKTLNLLPNTLAKQEAADRGADEAILHRDGTVTECSASNIMLVKNGIIRTHPANHLILHGITREVVLRLSRRLEIEVEERPFSLDEMAQADELFITGTTVEITPIIAVDDRPVGTGVPGPVTRTLQEAFSETIHQR